MKEKQIEELKEFIQRSADLGQFYRLSVGDITMLEVVDYINELETENKKIKISLCKWFTLFR